MQDRGDNYTFGPLHVKDPKGKAVEESAPEIMVDPGVKFRVFLNRQQSLIEFRSEFHAQLGPLLVVPFSCAGDIIFCLRSNNEPAAY